PCPGSAVVCEVSMITWAKRLRLALSFLVGLAGVAVLKAEDPRPQPGAVPPTGSLPPAPVAGATPWLLGGPGVGPFPLPAPQGAAAPRPGPGPPAQPEAGPLNSFSDCCPPPCPPGQCYFSVGTQALKRQGPQHTAVSVLDPGVPVVTTGPTVVNVTGT